MPMNETCVFAYQQVERTAELREVGLVYSIVVLITMVVSLGVWHLRRKTLRLVNRGFVFMVMTSGGLVCVLLAGPIWRYNTSYLGNNCVLDNFFYFICLPTIFWPLLVRLTLWANKIKLNYAIAGAVASTGLQRLKVDSPELKWKVYRASTRFGIYLCVVALAVYYLGILMLLEFVICPACGGVGWYSVAIFMAPTAIFFCLASYLIYNYREAPDTLYILRETSLEIAMAGLFGLFGFLMSFFDVLMFKQEPIIAFDWILFVDFGFILTWTLAVPYQVVRSFWEKGHKTSESKLSLRDILKTDRGKKIFELFLATDLSVENMFFYNAVTAWKDRYQKGGRSTLREAERIAEKYLTKSSYLEINVGQSLRNEAKQAVIDAKESEDQVLSPTIFDELAAEIFRLMANNSVERFQESDFYRLYLGEITPEMIPWLQFTGVSFYTMFRKSEHDSGFSLSALRRGSTKNVNSSRTTGWMSRGPRRNRTGVAEEADDEERDKELATTI